MKKKTPMSEKQHRAIGKSLFEARNMLGSLIGELLAHYAKNSKPITQAKKAQKEIDKLRSILDDIVFREEFPDPEDAWCGNAVLDVQHIYYPGSVKEKGVP
jgi:hypothetical protein